MTVHSDLAIESHELTGWEVWSLGVKSNESTFRLTTISCQPKSGWGEKRLAVYTVMFGVHLVLAYDVVCVGVH